MAGSFTPDEIKNIADNYIDFLERTQGPIKLSWRGRWRKWWRSVVEKLNHTFAQKV